MRPDGTFAVQLVLGTPPVPCPCVVHATLVGGTARGQVDAPLELTGHAMGETPTVSTAPVRLDLVEARIAGRPGWRSLFGAAATRTLVYTVHNPGPHPLPNPPLNVRIGRDGGGDRISTPGTGGIRPGETRTYRIPVTTPFAAFGRYTVQADLGGFGPAEATLRTYPWGLFLVHLLGGTLIIVGVARRIANRRDRPPLPAMAAAPTGTLLPSVVRVGSLGAYLVFDDAPGAGRLRRRANGPPERRRAAGPARRRRTAERIRHRGRRHRGHRPHRPRRGARRPAPRRGHAAAGGATTPATRAGRRRRRLGELDAYLAGTGRRRRREHWRPPRRPDRPAEPGPDG